MYDIFLALYEKFIASGGAYGGPFEWCLNFAVGTEYYSLLEQHACYERTLANYATITIDNWHLVYNIIDQCRFDELRSCYEITEEGLP